MRYLSIDTETTGLNPEKHSLVELAMVAEDSDHPDIPLTELTYFHCYVQHLQGAFWDPYCLALHRGDIMDAQTMKRTADRARRINDVEVYTPLEMEAAALQWLVIMGVTPENKATVAGKNYATFDRLFLPSSMSRYFSRRVLDAGSACVDWSAKELPSLKDLLGGVEPAHNALDDARDVIRVLRRLYTK